MSTYGRSVRSPGIHWNFPVTSWSGFSDVLIITYTGRAAKIAIRVSTIRRVQMNDIGLAVGDRYPLGMTTPPAPQGGERQVHRGHHEEEEQQQHGHGRAGA